MPTNQKKKSKKTKRPKSLMPISPADSFRCYVAPNNHGAEYIEENLDVNHCYGVEMQVFGTDDMLVIWLAPLPMEEAGPELCNFYLRCIEKLSNPELIEKTSDRHWANVTSAIAVRPLVSGTMEIPGLAMCFLDTPGFTPKMAREYMKAMGVKRSK